MRLKRAKTLHRFGKESLCLLVLRQCCVGLRQQQGNCFALKLRGMAADVLQQVKSRLHLSASQTGAGCAQAYFGVVGERALQAGFVVRGCLRGLVGGKQAFG